MKHLKWLVGLLLALGLAAPVAHANDSNGELRCYFKDLVSKCTLKYHECLAPAPDAVAGETDVVPECTRELKISCDGLQVFYEANPSRQSNEQNGIGLTLLGDENSDFPHAAIDEGLGEPFKNVFAHLYLTPWERLSGECWSDIRLFGRGAE